MKPFTLLNHTPSTASDGTNMDNIDPRFKLETTASREKSRDWPEDFSQENGNYFNKCVDCGYYFTGHKRRVWCKACQEPNWIEIAKKLPPEDTRRNPAWSGAWLEGEMVGYARCMVKFATLRAELDQAQRESEELRKVLEEVVNGGTKFPKYRELSTRITALLNKKEI